MPRPSVPKVPIICKECLIIFYVVHTRRDTAFFCSTPCHDIWRHKRAMQEFWNKVQRCAHEEWCIYCCWPWQGETENRYRNATFRNKPIGAHRLAWQLWNKRTMPPDLQAAHYCHFRACANPMHIHPATSIENFADSIRDHRIHSGENHHNSKLTREKAMEAFRLKVLGWDNKTIALHLDVSKSTIRNLMAGDIWKDVPRPPLLPKNKPPGRRKQYAN
jgi:hypothetical protein